MGSANRKSLLLALAAGLAVAAGGLALTALIPVSPPDEAMAARQRAWREGPQTSRPPAR